MEYIDAKTILSGYQAENPWFGYHYNMNLYKGCCHGCIYCDSRSNCYRVEDFDTVRAKRDAIALLRTELKTKRKSGVIATGSMSDPYNPFEQQLGLTRQALEWIDRYGFGVSIATKSDLIVRDIDLLKRIATHSPVICKVTITTVDEDLCGIIEPHAPATSRRFEAVARLSEQKIFTGLLLMPVLPFLTDSLQNVLALVRRAKQAGAKFLYPAFGMTLRANQRDYYFEAIDRLFPGLKQRYLRGYCDQYRCDCPNAQALYAAFAKECRAQGLLYRMQDIIEAYTAPYQDTQIKLF